jgi:hypothetical protein
MPIEEKEGADIDAEAMDSMVGEVVDGLGLSAPMQDSAETDPASPPSNNADGADKGAAPVAATASSSEPKPGPAPGAAPSASPKAPQSWTKEAQAEWDKLPPKLKAEIHKREEDVTTGFGKLNQVASIGQAFSEAVRPYFQTLQANRIDPARHAAELFGIHQQLAFGSPQQKVGVMTRLMKEFGVSAEMLGGADFQPPYVDPAVAGLTAEFQRLSSTQQQILSQQQAREVERITAEVNEFAKTHPHFDTLQPDIARLLETKAAPNLQAAYETALWANPVTRQAMIDAKEAERVAAETKARSERAKAARSSTAANVRTAPKGRGPTPAKGSIEDTLNEVANKIFAEAS